jgi:hypothetical protein
LALAFALDVGGTWGNGMCQRRRRESLPVAVRWGSPDSLFNVSGVFYVHRFLILYLSEVSNEAAVSLRGKWLFERSQSLILFFVGGEFVGEGMGANICVCAVVGFRSCVLSPTQNVE